MNTMKKPTTIAGHQTSCQCLLLLFLILVNNDIHEVHGMEGAQSGSFGAAFTNSWGPPETIYTTAGVLVGSRVILHVGHARGNGSCDGTIRNINQNTADAYQQHWTGQFYQHPLYSVSLSRYDFAIIILDAPIANLCVSSDSPRALPLPFDVETGKFAVSVDSLVPNVTKCRHYGFGYPDASHLQLGFSTHKDMYNVGDGFKNGIFQTMNVGSLCNGDSGGPTLCKVGCEWRLMGLNKGTIEPCGSINQQMIANNFLNPEFRDFFTALLREKNLVSDVVQAQQKCASIPFAWESDSEPICATPVQTTAAPVGQWIRIRCNNGLYMKADLLTADPLMWCTGSATDNGGRFIPVYTGNGKIALRSVATLKYVTSEYGYYPMHCNRDAFSSWELFTWVDNGADGTFSLKNDLGKFVSSENGQQAMWCNKDAAITWERFQWELAAPTSRNIRIRCNNGLFMTVEEGTDLLWCRAVTDGPRERFVFFDFGGGKLALKALATGKFVTTEYGQFAMHANRDAVGSWEYMYWVGHSNERTFSLKNGLDKFVSSENGQQAMWCNKDAAYTWERFQYDEVV